MDPIATDPRVAAALVGAAAAVVMAMVGRIYATFAERQTERRRRREQRLDVQTALSAEIMAHVHQLGQVDLEAHAERMLARMAQEPGFLPFVPRERHDAVFQAMLERIHLLPSETVEPVTLYYAQVAATAMLAEDLRSDAFRGMTPERQATMFRHFMEMKNEALRMGEVARDALRAQIRSDLRGISSSGRGRSGPGSEA